MLMFISDRLETETQQLIPLVFQIHTSERRSGKKRLTYWLQVRIQPNYQIQFTVLEK